MTLSAPPDAAERARALDPRYSFIVQAPAGSGKTELLIQRYLALLDTVEEPEEVLAITFTRKAAAEMRERVLKALEARQDARAANPARLRILTIDSLCAALTRQMPVLSRFGAQPEIVEDARELYAAAALATIARVEDEDAGGIAQHVEYLLEHLDNDVARVQALLAGMLARRDHWMRHVGRMHRADLESALMAERERAIVEMTALYPGKVPESVEAWQALAASLLTEKGTWRKRVAAASAFDAEGDVREPLRTALFTLRDLPPANYADAQWAVLEAIAGLLLPAVAQLKLVFQARGQVDFTEISQGALRALGEEGEPTDLALALDYRIRHLLIDEFQDTSISQYQLVARLTEGWEPGDGRTLFAVGDPMQSIYRFRQAEVGLFLQARQNGIGSVQLTPIELAANFRSQAGIVDWVNSSFVEVLPAEEDAIRGAVPYSRSLPVKTPEKEAAVTVHPFFDKDRAGEAARVAEIVRAVQAADPKATVAILVRARTHLAEIVPQFKSAGLAFRAIEIEELVHRPVVQDLLALTRALAHPADRLAWLAVLRAPWCGLTLEDLARIAEGREESIGELLADETIIASLSADGRARLERVRPVLFSARRNRLRANLRDSVEATWLALGGPAGVESDTDLEDAGIYLDHLEAHETAGALDEGFEEGLAKLYAIADVRADERLQIMTIHKAKGLEFDHVILPGLSRPQRSDERKLFLWMESVAGLLLAPIQAAGGDPDPIYAWLQRLETAKGGLEASRLLYVAATRAKSRLHLLGDVRIKDGAVVAPAASTLLGKLWPVVAENFEVAAAQYVTQHVAQHVAQQGGEPAPLSQTLLRFEASWRLAAPPAAVAWAVPPEPGRVGEDIEFIWAGETARHVGSVVHRWLQRMAEEALRGWDEGRINALRLHFARALGERGVSADEIPPAVERICSALVNTLDDPRGRWLLGPGEDAASELRLRVLQGGRLRTLVIDRTFVAEGRRWVVDYKTSRHEGADLEAFLERERERYAPQLARYAQALGGARLGLYFPMLRGWREWNSNEDEKGTD